MGEKIFKSKKNNMWEKNWSKLCLWASRRYDKQKNVKILVPCALIRMRQLWANFLWTNSMPKNDLRVWHHLVLFENLFLKKKVPQGIWGIIQMDFYSKFSWWQLTASKTEVFLFTKVEKSKQCLKNGGGLHRSLILAIVHS